MKVAIVLGFFDPVLVRLQKEYPARLQEQSIVWIGTLRPHGNADLQNFKELLFDRLATRPSEVFVVAVVKRGKEETLERAIENICIFATDRHPDVLINRKRFAYALDEEGLVAELNRFFEVPPVVEVFPGSLEGLEEWCKTYMAGNIFLHPRALEGAKKSIFTDVALVYKCLRLLGTEYRLNRLDGGSKTRSKLNDALGKLGVALTPSISLAAAKQHGEDYFVHYPIECGLERKEFLEFHLKKGVDHDERSCMRVYFFWDKRRRIAVVGWLTSHLGTRKG